MDAFSPAIEDTATKAITIYSRTAITASAPIVFFIPISASPATSFITFVIKYKVADILRIVIVALSIFLPVSALIISPKLHTIRTIPPIAATRYPITCPILSGFISPSFFIASAIIEIEAAIAIIDPALIPKSREFPFPPVRLVIAIKEAI